MPAKFLSAMRTITLAIMKENGQKSCDLTETACRSTNGRSKGSANITRLTWANRSSNISSQLLRSKKANSNLIQLSKYRLRIPQSCAAFSGCADKEGQSRQPKKKR